MALANWIPYSHREESQFPQRLSKEPGGDVKPYYTIDAGEFLVGSRIERELPDVSLWFPAKDDGDDLLLLDRKLGRFCTVQIKVSRDYLATHMDALFHPHLECCGWFTPKRSKIEKSRADFWLIGLHSYGHHRLSVLVIPPRELLRRYDDIHGRAERIQSYFWITKTRKAFESRGLSKDDQRKVLENRFVGESRDFTQFLDKWEDIRNKLKSNVSDSDFRHEPVSPGQRTAGMEKSAKVR
jgi:hypothetical protein